MNWLVEFFDSDDVHIWTESFVGVGSAAAVSSRIAQRLSTDPLLDKVAGWWVQRIDHPVDIGDKQK